MNPIFLCVFFWLIIFVLKTPKNAMKHMLLSFKMKEDVVSDHFLMLWFQKDSLDTVCFRTFRTFKPYGGVWAHFPQRGLNLKSCVLPISLQEPLKHL